MTLTMEQQRASEFPLGAKVTLSSLNVDPNRTFDELRPSEPVSWVPCTETWFVTRFDDIASVLRDSETFSVEDPTSLLNNIFGSQILSVDGELHDAYRRPVQPSFSPKAVRESMEERTRKRASQLISTFEARGRVDLRYAFASRYPVLNILDFFGLSDDLEKDMRKWYDSFEQALSNFENDPDIAAEGQRNAEAFKTAFLDQLAASPSEGLLAAISASPDVSADQVARNALTIFFGGISTVEALVLNAMWILCTHEDIRQSIENDRSLLPTLLDETMRWASPVQSSIRIATRDTTVGGVEIKKGERVACMLGAGNRDPEVWDAPNEIRLDRPNLGRHIGFSMGRHFCLGKHLAKFEALIAIDLMLDRLKGFRFTDNAPAIRGYEFRQPRRLPISWDI